MERLLYLLIFSGLCPFAQTTSRQYILIQTGMTWDNAQVYCRQNYIDLATAQTAADWTNLQTAVGSATSVWTGLYYDVNSWKWSYHGEPKTFSNFYSDEPNNSDGHQECVAYYYGDWNDLACDFEFYFFCYDDTQTGNSRYILITDLLRTWQDALTYCRQHYTDLAIIRSLSDNDVLNVAVPSNDYVWIGMYRDTWKWSDGTNVSTYPINWASYQPDMTGIDRTCGAADYNGLIDDVLCTDILPFICMQNLTTTTTTAPTTTAPTTTAPTTTTKAPSTTKAPPTTGPPTTGPPTTAPTSSSSSYVPESNQQIMRLEVKSSLDVNDPAVMEIILQWIKQNLENHGIDYTGLTWRLQPEKNVFTLKPEEEIIPDQRNSSEFPFDI